MKEKVLIILLLILAPSFSLVASDPIQRAEQSIASASHEIVIVFNRSMRQIAHFEGGATSTLVYVSWQWRGGTLTHNHPGLPSLSPSDLHVAEVADLKEIRAVSVTMGYTVCRAWKTRARWPHFDVPQLDTQAQALIKHKEFAVQEQVLRGYYAGLSRQLGFGYGCNTMGSIE